MPKKAPKKLYNMPEKIPEGTILTDRLKKSYRVGPSIGIGGFGEVYTACKVGEKNYDYVVKCEPSENGPLFVEMNFYMRCGKEADVENYRKKQGLKSFGMPHLVASGSITLNDKSHRFLVMPRFGQNLEHFFLANGERLPIGTVYRLAIQMLDVLEYVHQCGYVHGDLKATNMLLGLGKNGNAQAYLVDFGLAARYHTDKDFKPDPKKAHNGTMEFESRDCHQGVITMRSDLEILGYNLIHWLGAKLPWVRDKLLNAPNKVQAAKVQFMNQLETELKKLFPESVPVPLAEYFKYINKLKHNETPDYKKCRKLFQDALKALKIADNGNLELELKKSNKTAVASISTATKRPAKIKRVAAIDETGNDTAERNASDDDDDDVIFEPSPRKRIAKPALLKTTKIPTSPIKKPEGIKVSNKKTPSPLRSKRISPRGNVSTNDISPTRKKLKSTPPLSAAKRGTPLSAKANINFSPSISLSKKTPSITTRHGNTIVNDNVTPNPRADKTYEFNFELDVSMDANVIVNVKRKKKANTDEPASTSKGTPKSSASLSNGTRETPSKTVRVEKVNESKDGNRSSPRTPIVKVVKKVKRGI